MYHIAVLSQNQDTGRQIAGWTREYCSLDGIFPQIDIYEEPERFYQDWKTTAPCVVIVNLPGIAGLNEVEHIRSLSSQHGLIWCSDLDFSLHAFRLRADYFILTPVSRQSLWEGLSVWTERLENGVRRKQARLKFEEGSLSRL